MAIIMGNKNLQVGREEEPLHQEKPANLSVAQAYEGVPRSAPFVKHCLAMGKTEMNQLTTEDFAQASALKGVGEASAKGLLDVFLKYEAGELPMAGSTVKLSGDKTTLEGLYGDVAHGRQLIRYCHMHGMDRVSDLQNFSFDAKEVAGIGPGSMEHLRMIYLQSLEELPRETGEEMTKVALINEKLPITALEGLVGDAALLQRLSFAGCQRVKDLYAAPISQKDRFLLRGALDYLQVPVPQRLEDELHQLKDTAKYSLLQKSKGQTLQSIADTFGLTRERVRQIITGASRRLLGVAELCAGIAAGTNGTFYGSDISPLFLTEEMGLCCLFILRESTRYRYMKFCDKYIHQSVCPQNVEALLDSFAKEFVGDGINYCDHLDTMEKELADRRLGCFDFEDIMNALIQRGYRFYGDYVVRGKSAYSVICYDAIVKYFPFDIKLDGDRDNEDMRRLRTVVHTHYGGLSLPDNNRALTAGLTRNSQMMVLSGRGRYCPIEKVVYRRSLLEEIRRYIYNSPQSSFYYRELFEKFKGPLMDTTSITNSNFLHGMLMYAYPEEFRFERDLLVKNGRSREDVNDRLCQLLKKEGHAMTVVQLQQAIPGINDFVISFIAARVPKFIQWEYGAFNHMDNISYTAEDVERLGAIVKEQTDKNGGYMSENMLYTCAKGPMNAFMEKNHIANSLNLYFVAAYLLQQDYRFRRPHILSREFPATELSAAGIASALLQCGDAISFDDYVALANRVGWPVGTQHAVFSEMERDFFRVDEKHYVRKSCLSLSPALQVELTDILKSLLGTEGYCPVGQIAVFRKFPPFSYPWNGFLLASLVEEYGLGCKLIHPQVRHRRHMRSILLSEKDPCNTFEDLVLRLLQAQGVTHLSEGEMFRALKGKGLVTKVIPRELYHCDGLGYEGNSFHVKQRKEMM